MKKHTTIPVKSMKFDNQDGNNYSVNLNVKNDTKANFQVSTKTVQNNFNKNKSVNVCFVENTNAILQQIVDKIKKNLQKDKRFYEVKCDIDNNKIIGSYKYSECPHKDKDATRIFFEIERNNENKEFTINYIVNGNHAQTQITAYNTGDIVSKIEQLGGDNYYEFIDNDGNIINENGNIVDINNKKNRNIGEENYCQFMNESGDVIGLNVVLKYYYIAEDIKQALHKDTNCTDVKCTVDGKTITITYKVYDAKKNGHTTEVTSTITPIGSGETFNKNTTIKTDKLTQTTDDIIGIQHIFKNIYEDNKAIQNGSFSNKQISVSVEQNIAMNNYGNNEISNLQSKFIKAKSSNDFAQ